MGTKIVLRLVKMVLTVSMSDFEYNTAPVSRHEILARRERCIYLLVEIIPPPSTSSVY